MSQKANFRMITERVVLQAVAKSILSAGYAISVNDSEETTLKRSTDLKAILSACFTTDEDFLLVHGRINEQSSKKHWSPNHFGWVRFIYGNSGLDVVNDYTTNLEEAMKAPSALAEKMENWDGVDHQVAANAIEKLFS